MREGKMEEATSGAMLKEIRQFLEHTEGIDSYPKV
jgi:hypothetical protein